MIISCIYFIGRNSPRFWGNNFVDLFVKSSTTNILLSYAKSQSDTVLPKHIRARIDPWEAHLFMFYDIPQFRENISPTIRIPLLKSYSPDTHLMLTSNVSV